MEWASDAAQIPSSVSNHEAVHGGGGVSLTTSFAQCQLHAWHNVKLHASHATPGLFSSSVYVAFWALGSGRGNSSPRQRKECFIPFPLEGRGLMLLLEESTTSGLIINLGMDRPLGKHFLSGGTKCSSVALLQGCSALILSQWR